MGTQIPRVPSWTPEELRDALTGSRSIREICFGLGLKATGGNYTTIKRVAKDNGIDLTTLDGKRWRTGETRPVVPPRPLKELLVKGSRVKPAALKKKLVAAGLMIDVCSTCGCPPEWNGEPLVLQLDHRDGDTENNRRRNLRVLCPNCHSQTKTFAGRNCGRRQ